MKQIRSTGLHHIGVRSAIVAAAGAVVLLGGCVEVPSSPTVAVMPSPYKPFEVFQADDQICRGFAYQQVGGKTEGGAINNATATGVVAGAAVGAASGALIGGSGSAAGIGAGAGALAGGAIGNSYGYQSAYGLQYRYNIAYEQCMYSKGNQVPGFAAPTSLPPPSAPPPPAAAP